MLLYLTLLTVVGCESFLDDRTKSKPGLDSLVGTWVPDKGSTKYMREVGGYNASHKTALVLEADGTYKMVNMPDWLWLDDGESHGTLRSENGTWEVAPDGDRTEWIVWLRSQLKARTVALHGQHPPYRLRFSFGNVDTNPQTMSFVKED